MLMLRNVAVYLVDLYTTSIAVSNKSNRLLEGLAIPLSPMSTPRYASKSIFTCTNGKR